MNTEIAGSGVVAPGEYDKISTSGSGTLNGPIRCKELECAGSVRCIGTVEAEGKIETAGSADFDSDIRCHSLECAGSAQLKGSCTVTNTLVSSGALKVSGDIKAGKSVDCAGSVTARSIEAEKIYIDGSVKCEGLINGEVVELSLSDSSEIGGIGGSIIRIEQEYGRKKAKRRKDRKPLLAKLLGNAVSTGLTVKEAIEGDEIALENVSAKTVSGRIVAIGSDCFIELVQYSEELEIADDAKVDRTEKINI